ncbi:unnamed protein product, partial [Symbiodinium necroappetens]
MEDLCNSGLSQLMEATKELQLVESLIPEGSLGFGQCSWFDGPKITEDMELELDMNRQDEAPTNGGWSEQSRPAKWRRKDAKGQGDQGKGPSKDQQDTAYMFFVRADLEGNLGSILYEAGRKWNEVKATTPDKLEAPMRIILMQKLLLTVLERYNAMMASEEKIAKAKQMGWLSEIPPKDCVSVKEGLSAMAVLCSSPRVVNRFHATRQMAEAYESPTMMDVGLRTVEAGKMWHLLNDLAHSAVWLMAGAYMRPRSPGSSKGQGKGKGKGNKQGQMTAAGRGLATRSAGLWCTVAEISMLGIIKR